MPEPSVPWVVTLHDVAHHAIPQHFSRAERLYRAYAYDRPARRAGRVITSSRAAKADIVKYLGINPDMVIPIYHGVDFEVFCPAPRPHDSAVLQNYSLPESFIYYPANFWPHKNHLRLLQALRHVKDRRLHLVLTGHGNIQTLQEFAQHHRMADRVHYLGYVPSQVVPALYRASQAVIYPSLFEGFGIPVIEAMACGVPVASSSRGALAELTAGMTVKLDPDDPRDIADAIERIVYDRRLRDSIIPNGLRYARGFSWDACVTKHIAAYEHLLSYN
jgi:glycosyltransferase involved in cell wall biosynthesis